MLETSHDNVWIWKYSPDATNIVQTTFEDWEQATAGIQKSSFQPGNMQDPHLQICLQMHVKFIWFSNASAKFWDLWTKISWPRSPKTSLEDLVTRPETCSHRLNTSLAKKSKFLPLLVTSQATSKSSSSSTGSGSSSQAGSSPLRDVMDRERDSGIFSRRDVSTQPLHLLKGRWRAPGRWRSAVSTQGRDLSGVQPAYPGHMLFTTRRRPQVKGHVCLMNKSETGHFGIYDIRNW